MPQARKPVCSQCHEALDVSGAPIEVSTERYQQIVASSPMPVVVDFTAPWAAPCRAADEVVEQFARRQAGKVLVLKVNFDKSKALIDELGIKAIPTFQAVKGGEEFARHAGLLHRAAFDRWAERAFTRAAA